MTPRAPLCHSRNVLLRGESLLEDDPKEKSATRQSIESARFVLQAGLVFGHACVFAEPAESNMNLLDQMSVTDTSDQEALDDFLNSADVDVGAGPSVKSG